MASNTPNLDLYKKDPTTDGDETFNIETMMNDNWDKIDAGFGDLDDAFNAHLDDYAQLVATKVIDSSGSNSDGSWIRFTDGTQICWTRKYGTDVDLSGSSQNFPYPMSFVGNPTVIPGISTSFSVSNAVQNALKNSFVNGNANQWIVRIPNSADRTDDPLDSSSGYTLLAIGRWKN